MFLIFLERLFLDAERKVIDLFKMPQNIHCVTLNIMAMGKVKTGVVTSSKTTVSIDYESAN